MAKKTKVRSGMTDDEKVAEWLKNKKNKIKSIPRNVSGECVMKGFFARRKKHPFKKSIKTKNAESK